MRRSANRPAPWPWGIVLLGLAACGVAPSDEQSADPERTAVIDEALSYGNHGFAWVTVNTATGSWVVQSNFSFNSGSPAIPIVSHTGPGLYTVGFGGLATQYAGPGRGGNVQVVATNQAGTGSIYNNTRCKVTGWSLPPIQNVSVACHNAAGALADSPFVVHYFQRRVSSFGASGYVLTTGDPTSGIPYNPDPAWSGNTAEGLNTVQRTGVGAYSVTFGGLAAPLCGLYPPCYGGNPQVTAYDPAGAETAAYCKLTGFTPSGADEIVNVQCYDGSGNPGDSRFSLNFDHRPSSPFTIGAHAFANDALSASYTPDPAYSYNSDPVGTGSGTNLALRQVKGVYQLRHFGLENNKAAPHVTAFGPDNRHCKIEKWGLIPGLGTGVQVETRCWNPTGGAPQDSLYAELFVSRRAPKAPDADGDGYTPAGGDCNDAVPTVHPGASEVCDNLDNDCDSAIDDGACLVSAVAGGDSHVCALLDEGRVKCWGKNSFGQLGVGDIANRGDGAGEMGAGLPLVELGLGRTAVALAAGGLHTCALLDNGQVKCWGKGSEFTGIPMTCGGTLGLGDGEHRGDNPGEMADNLPAVNLGSGRRATAIAAGGGGDGNCAGASCALLDNGQVKCWGLNHSGQLGLGDIVNRGETPAQMGDNLPAVDLGTGRTATAIARGSRHTCALLDNSQVKCWGVNNAGQLGLGDTANRGDGPGEMGDNLSVVSLGTGRTATAISAHNHHTCAVLDNGQVKCWGENTNGQLGLGDTANRGDGAGEMGDSLPVVSLGTGRTASTIAKGIFAHTCVVLDNSELKCWGRNTSGQLGLGDTANRGDGAGEMGDSLPAVALGTGRTASALAMGSSSTCSVLDNGQVKCWGANNFGQLGQGDTVQRGDNAGEMGDNLLPVDL